MRRRRKRRGPLRRSIAALFYLLLLAAIVWGVGFFLFLREIPRLRAPAADTAKADAIVVLTGGSGRLERGFQLLANGDAAKLFISGVDPEVKDTVLLQNRQLDAALLACCVTLGHAANDTFGNAAETAKWMAEQGFSSLHIVTANYHMPRSLIVFGAAMPAVKLLPQPVHSAHVHLDNWWRWPGTVELLAIEYSKYLATRARLLLLR